MHLRGLATVLALVLTACGVAGDGAGTEPPADNTTTTSDAATTTVDGITTTSEAEMDSTLVAKATQDLAVRLDIAETDIELLEVRDVQWPDGALGCPEPGQMYTQAVVEGWQVLLGVDERIYAYHAGADGEPFLCPSEEKDGGYDFVPPPGFDES